MHLVNCIPEKMNLSFSGCGFLCVYHAGVAAAIKEYAPYLTRNKISGASAGAILAACLITDVCLSHATSTIIKIVSNARARSFGPLHPEFDLLGLVRKEMYEKLPADAYKRCTGRLQISLTNWESSENVLVSKFDSNDDLINAIICSCFIPLYCGNTPPKFQGIAYIDGGFSDNQPVYDAHTVTVSPFSGESDICPIDWDSASLFGFSFSKTSIRLTSRNFHRLASCLMPPSADDCSRMCLQGFEDALRFLSRTIAPCIRCLTLQINIYNGAEETVPAVEGQQLPLVKTQVSGLAKAALLRRRLVSECDFCGDGENINSSTARELFPSILRKAIEEAYADEESAISEFLPLRLFQYTRRTIGFGLLPFELFIIFAKKFSSWLAGVVLPEWLYVRIQKFIAFLLAEIERQKSRLSQFSCLLPTPKVSRPLKHLEIELSEDGKKDLAFIREIDRIKRAAAEKKASVRIVTPPTAPEWSLLDDAANEDSLHHVVEYTKSHDTIYEFHYLDENNQVHSFEIFNVAGPYKRHDCHSHMKDASAPSQSTSVVVEEQQNELIEQEDGAGPSGAVAQVDTVYRDASQSPSQCSPSSSRMSSRGKVRCPMCECCQPSSRSEICG